MRLQISLLVFFLAVALCTALKVKRAPWKRPLVKGCVRGELKKEGKATCLCNHNSWKCTFGKGNSCKFGTKRERDSTIKKEAGLTCLCVAGKWACVERKRSVVDVVKKRIKRQRDVCKFGPKKVLHGDVYEFGIDCNCVNGKFKCKKYSRFRKNMRQVAEQYMTQRDANHQIHSYHRSFQSRKVFHQITRSKRAGEKRGGDSCSFVKSGEKITRLNGQRFAYGMRCDCTDGQIHCINKRV